MLASRNLMRALTSCGALLIAASLAACGDVDAERPDVSTATDTDAPDGSVGDARGDTPVEPTDAAADPDTAGGDGATEAGNDVDECDADASWDAVRPVFQEYCLGCHSASRTGAARSGAPEGVNFDTEDDVRRLRDRVRFRVLDTETMPPVGALDACARARLEALLDRLDDEVCVPACGERECGGDGCDGSCGECGDGFLCVLATGVCEEEVCDPACDGLSCGDDGCGGTCGSCSSAERCTDVGLCECVPDCTDAECGDNGCGGVCGTCGVGSTCSGDRLCECVPDCGDAVCGDDGCGGSCGTCPGALVCDSADGVCVATCTPDCSGRACGDDGCDGPCGACGDGLECIDFACECAPDCAGRVCGNDGCGGTCGTCPDGTECGAGGACECAPDCAGATCGSDGCGGTCGECPDDDTCSGGTCVAATRFADVVWPILSGAGCGSTSCHGGRVPQAGLDLSSSSTAYAQLVDQPSSQCGGRTRVVPGSPTTSYLVNKLTGVGMCFGSRMPKAGTPLSAGSMDAINAWIAEGAAP